MMKTKMEGSIELNSISMKVLAAAMFGCCSHFPFCTLFLCTSNHVTVGTIRDDVNTPTHEICCMAMNLRRKGNNACDYCVHDRRAMAEV